MRIGGQIHAGKIVESRAPSKRKIDMPIHQSFNVGPIGGENQDLDALFGELARIGFEGVEAFFPKDLDRIAEAAKKHGLSMAALVGHNKLTDGLNNEQNHDRIEQELRASIDRAVAHGCRGLVCFAGNRQPGQSDDEAMVVTARGLRRIAPYAEEKGIDLNMELLNSKVNHPFNQCDSTDWGLAVCEMVDSPRVKLLFDIYHMQVMEGDVIRNLKKALPRIGHFHTAGVPGRQDLDDEQELHYGAICRAIAATGYDGYVGHEFKPKGETIPALRQAFEVCNVA
jgi:hydroxypyruvate isomerase